MTRQLLLGGLCSLLLAGPAAAQFRSYSPDSGGAQNNSGGWQRQPRHYSPDSGGAQNMSGGWRPNNGWQNNSGWNQGSHWQQPQYQHWQHQHQYQPQHQHQYQPQYHNYDHQPQYQARAYTPPAPPPVVYSNLPISIAMPDGEPGLCSYVLSSGDGSWNYNIGPGQRQTFNEDRAWKVTFDRGNGYGQQSYALHPGLYRFRMSARGWELYRSSASTAAIAPGSLPGFAIGQ